MAPEGAAEKRVGQRLKEVFKNADEIAELHACLTSLRGNNFRFRLLQALEAPMDETEVEQLRIDSGINEYHRHLNWIVSTGLTRVHEVDDGEKYVRTGLGEAAVNSVRSLVRRVGDGPAQAIFAAALGPNSIRFFLRIYDEQREPDWNYLQIRYTAAEIGRISLFLPRTIEGISAIDKLNDGELLTYRDDNHVYIQPSRARSFYQYLLELHAICTANRGLTGTGTAGQGDGSRLPPP